MAERILQMRDEIALLTLGDPAFPRLQNLIRELPVLEQELGFWMGLRDRDVAWASVAPSVAEREAELERKRPRFGRVMSQPTIWPGSPSAPAGAWRE